MKKTVLAILLILTACFCMAADLMDFIGPDYAIFSADRPRFITRKNQIYFNWVSSEKETVRYPGYANSPKLTCFEQPVQEVLFRFKNDTLNSIYISIYNRGDAGPITMERMKEILIELNKRISARMRSVRSVYKKIRLTNAAPVYTLTWTGSKYTFRLIWSCTGRRTHEEQPEYIQIELFRSNSAQSETANITERLTEQTRDQLIRNVKQDNRGAVWIDGVPMVDQGQKGYCAAAVTERVFRYYGYPMTQHTFAQLAGTDASRGTNSDALTAALKKTAGKFGVRVRESFKLVNSVEDIERLVQLYNKQARKNKKPRIQLVTRGNMLYVDETLRQMDPELYAAVRRSDRSGFRRFSNILHSRTDEGLPTIWFVTLGLVPEEMLNPQSRGGHVRLLIGYNDRTREVIYTDSWGRGHERKSMPIENAWTITNLLLNVDPKR